MEKINGVGFDVRPIQGINGDYRNLRMRFLVKFLA